jgi:hypothetical protein
MALPTTREELKQYCLRKLGHPVIQINVANEQIEDRIDEALEMFQQYHFDGVEKIYLPHKVTASEMVFTAATPAFNKSEVLIGQVSNASVTFIDADSNTARFVYNQASPQLIPGETLVGQQTALTATLVLTPNYVTLGDLDNKFIPITGPILSVLNVLDLNQSTSNMFDVRYQFYLNNMPNFTSMDMISYDMFNKHLALLNFEFSGLKPLRFNKKMDRLYVDFDWHSDPAVDRYIVFECLRSLDPADYPKIWSDYFLREYCSSLIKKQWGSHLIKYGGVSLPGNVTLNGEKIYNEAVKELEVLEERLHKEFQLPIDFLVG